jgi:hypothetical protein
MRYLYVYTNVQDVRKAALESILTTHATLPDIIRRVRDTSEDVRKYAFEVSQAMHTTYLLLKHALLLLKIRSNCTLLGS